MYILNIETHVWKEELEKVTQAASLLSYVVKPRLNSRTYISIFLYRYKNIILAYVI